MVKVMCVLYRVHFLKLKVQKILFLKDELIKIAFIFKGEK